MMCTAPKRAPGLHLILWGIFSLQIWCSFSGVYSSWYFCRLTKAGAKEKMHLLFSLIESPFGKRRWLHECCFNLLPPIHSRKRGQKDWKSFRRRPFPQPSEGEGQWARGKILPESLWLTLPALSDCGPQPPPPSTSREGIRHILSNC